MGLQEAAPKEARCSRVDVCDSPGRDKVPQSDPTQKGNLARPAAAVAVQLLGI